MNRRLPSRNTNDIGYSYIEINLTRQRMVLYQEWIPDCGYWFCGKQQYADRCLQTGMKSNPQEAVALAVDFWMPFTDKLGIYGDSGLVITGTDVSDETGDSGDFGSSEESVDFGSSDSWMSTEGCIVLPEEQAQTIYQNVDSGYAGSYILIPGGKDLNPCELAHKWMSCRILCLRMMRK